MTGAAADIDLNICTMFDLVYHALQAMNHTVIVEDFAFTGATARDHFHVFVHVPERFVG